MRRGYGQYCPLALATEILCQRWTILVISRLIDGCSTFNEIHQGVPRISPSLLSKRLSELEHAGIVERRKARGASGYRYEITQAGRELEDVIWQLSVWGQNWARDMQIDDLDPAFLAWSMHLRMNVEAMPPGRTVLEFSFTGTPAEFRRFWLVARDEAIDMCLKYPGFETDLLIEADIREFVECWRGFEDLSGKIRAGHIRLTGPSELRRAFPEWLMLSMLAPYPRRRPGREQQLSRATTPRSSATSA